MALKRAGLLIEADEIAAILEVLREQIEVFVKLSPEFLVVDGNISANRIILVAEK